MLHVMKKDQPEEKQQWQDRQNIMLICTYILVGMYMEEKKILQVQKTADGFLESCALGRKQLLAIIESFGATLGGYPKVIMLGVEAFWMSFSKGKHGWVPVIN